MKYLLYISFLFGALYSNAQNKQTRVVLANAALLKQTVFGTKDSATLESLFASGLTYGHSSGKIETRAEAIQGIIHNKSVYVEAIEPMPYNFSMRGDSAVVKHVFKATEKKADGTEGKLNITIELVWIKEKGEWKLIRRQATKNL